MIGQECIDPFDKWNQLISQTNWLDSITYNKCGSTNKLSIKVKCGYNKMNHSTLYQPTVEPLSQYPIGLVI